MSNEYTPTTGQVRVAYVRAIRNAFVGSTSEHEEEFIRWLAQVKAEAEVRALRVFRRELIEHQFERYGRILPDVHEVVDDLAASADGIAHALDIDSKGGSK